MPAFRRVLVGFDGTDPAFDALALARRLVDRDAGELLVARIDPTRSFRRPHANHPAPTADRLERAIDEIGDGIRVRAVERIAASAARGLTELAETEGADLLVIGAHHHGPDGHASPGPTSSRLLQGAPCAVAVAPRGDREADRFHYVGVAFDGSPEANAALEAAYALAARDGAAVSLYLAVGHTGTAYAGADAEALLQAERAHGQELLDTAADAAPAGVNPQTVLLTESRRGDRAGDRRHRRHPVRRLAGERPVPSRTGRERVRGVAAGGHRARRDPAAHRRRRRARSCCVTAELHRLPRHARSRHRRASARPRRRRRDRGGGAVSACRGAPHPARRRAHPYRMGPRRLSHDEVRVVIATLPPARAAQVLDVARPGKVEDPVAAARRARPRFRMMRARKRAPA